MLKDKIGKIAWIMPLISGIAWGSAGIFVRVFSHGGMSNLGIICYRMLFASMAVGIGLLLFDRKALKIDLKDLWLFVVAGLVGMGFLNICYNEAINTLSLSLATVLLALAPVFVLILARIFLKEKIGSRKLLCALLAILGCAMISGIFEDTLKIDFRGFVFGISSGFFYGLYSIIAKKITNRGYSGGTINLYGSISAFICLLPFGAPLKNMEIMLDKDLLLIMILHALLISAIPYALFNYSFAFLDAGKVAVLASVEPASAMVFDVLVYGDRPSFLGVLGLITTVAAIALLNLPEKRKAS